jgi:hypothetical protein
MDKEFVPYQESLELKELGFDEPCLGHYQDNVEAFTHKQIKGKLNLGFMGQCKSEPYDWNNAPKWGTKSQIFYSAPTYSQAFRWFRKKYRLDGHVTFPESSSNKIEGINSVYYDIEIYTLTSGDAYKTYKFTGISDDKEEAELACLKKLIELVKNK